MDSQSIIRQADNAFKAAADHLADELTRLRTGRANPSMLDGVMVEAYGTAMPMNQVGTVSTPEAQLIQITPFDPNNLQAIATAIRNSPSLGLNPSDDGRVVRIQIPALTEERRREIAKQIGEKVEDSMVRMRNARHEAFKQIDGAKKAKQLGEDEAKRSEKTIDENMTQHRQRIDTLAKAKESEILNL